MGGGASAPASQHQNHQGVDIVTDFKASLPIYDELDDNGGGYPRGSSNGEVDLDQDVGKQPDGMQQLRFHVQLTAEMSARRLAHEKGRQNRSLLPMGAPKDYTNKPLPNCWFCKLKMEKRSTTYSLRSCGCVYHDSCCVGCIMGGMQSCAKCRMQISDEELISVYPELNWREEEEEETHQHQQVGFVEAAPYGIPLPASLRLGSAPTQPVQPTAMQRQQRRHQEQQQRLQFLPHSTGGLSSLCVPSGQQGQHFSSSGLSGLSDPFPMVGGGTSERCWAPVDAVKTAGTTWEDETQAVPLLQQGWQHAISPELQTLKRKYQLRNSKNRKPRSASCDEHEKGALEIKQLAENELFIKGPVRRSPPTQSGQLLHKSNVTRRAAKTCNAFSTNRLSQPEGWRLQSADMDQEAAILGTAVAGPRESSGPHASDASHARQRTLSSDRTRIANEQSYRTHRPLQSPQFPFPIPQHKHQLAQHEQHMQGRHQVLQMPHHQSTQYAPAQPHQHVAFSIKIEPSLGSEGLGSQEAPSGEILFAQGAARRSHLTASANAWQVQSGLPHPIYSPNKRNASQLAPKDAKHLPSSGGQLQLSNLHGAPLPPNEVIRSPRARRAWSETVNFTEEEMGIMLRSQNFQPMSNLGVPPLQRQKSRKPDLQGGQASRLSQHVPPQSLGPYPQSFDPTATWQQRQRQQHQQQIEVLPTHHAPRQVQLPNTTNCKQEATRLPAEIPFFSTQAAGPAVLRSASKEAGLVMALNKQMTLLQLQSTIAATNAGRERKLSELEIRAFAARQLAIGSMNSNLSLTNGPSGQQLLGKLKYYKIGGLTWQQDVDTEVHRILEGGSMSIYAKTETSPARVRMNSEDGQLVLDAVIIKGRLHVRDFREVMFQCQNLVEVFVNGVPISAEDAAAGFWTFLGEFYLDAVSFYVGLDIADG